MYKKLSTKLCQIHPFKLMLALSIIQCLFQINTRSTSQPNQPPFHILRHTIFSRMLRAILLSGV